MSGIEKISNSQASLSTDITIKSSVEYREVMPAISVKNQFSGIDIAANPGLGPNNYSSPHQDSYCSESVGLTGPTSKYLKVIKKLNPFGFTACMGCNSNNQMIGVAVEPETKKFHLIVFDKDCEILAWAPTGNVTTGTFGGGYFFINSDEDTVVVGDNLIQCFSTSNIAADTGEITATWSSDDIVALVDADSSSSLYSVMPVWGEDNLYWCLLAGKYEDGTITSTATMAVVEILPDTSQDNGCTTTLKGSYTPNESYNNNTFAVDENGAYFVSNTLDTYGYLIAVQYDDNNGVTERWTSTYDSCGYLKTGQKNIGSGTTPTLMDVSSDDIGDTSTKYVVITDNADPQMNVMVYDRDTGAQLNKTPVFSDMRSCNEASVVGVERSIFVENNYGHTLDWPFSQYVSNEPGMAALTINASETESSIDWTDERSAFFAMTMLARESGVIYAHTADWSDDVSANRGGMFYIDARDSYTGRVIWRIPMGRGIHWCHEYGGIYFNYDNDLFVGTLRYLVSVQDISAEEYAINKQSGDV